MSKTYRAWDAAQARLLPPSVHDLVADDDPAHLVREIVVPSWTCRRSWPNTSGNCAATSCPAAPATAGRQRRPTPDAPGSRMARMDAKLRRAGRRSRYRLRQQDRRAGLRPDQGRPRLPPAPLARLRSSQPRTGAALHRPQPHQACRPPPRLRTGLCPSRQARHATQASIRSPEPLARQAPGSACPSMPPVSGGRATELLPLARAGVEPRARQRKSARAGAGP